MTATKPIQPTSEMAVFLDGVVRALGGRRSVDVTRLIADQLDTHSDIDAVASASNLLGLLAFPTSKVPVSWYDNLDGAVAAKIAGSWVAIVRHEGDVILVPEDTSATEHQILSAKEMISFRLMPEAEAAQLTYSHLAARARVGFRHIAWQSLVINLCALTVPFFTMAVYDRVLGGGAEGALWALLSGAVIVLALMFLMRRIRAQLVTAEHARFSASVSLALARKIFRQPYVRRDGLTTDRAMGRVRMGERAADIFASANVTAIYDAPFLVLTLLAIVFVGGAMVLVPALYLFLFLVLGLYVGSIGAGSDPEAAKLTAERQSRLGELTGHHGTIRTSGMSDSWLKRFDQVTRSVARDTFRSQKRSGALQAIGYVLGTGAALLTLIVGLERVLLGDFSAGALMGIMLLTWRVTGPAQALFLALPRLKSTQSGWTQLRALLATPTVVQNVHTQETLPDETPAISAQGLYYRYAPGAATALAGATFEIPAGSTVVVLGPNGAGKSTLLRILAGSLSTQSGSLLLNGRAIDQFDPDDYAAKVVYIPSGDSEFLVSNQAPKPDRPVSPLYLLDDPQSLDPVAGHTRLQEIFAAVSGRATLIVATHDTALAEHADLAIVLDRGGLAYFGPVKKKDADEALPETSEESH